MTSDDSNIQKLDQLIADYHTKVDRLSLSVGTNPEGLLLESAVKDQSEASSSSNSSPKSAANEETDEENPFAKLNIIDSSDSDCENPIQREEDTWNQSINQSSDWKYRLVNFDLSSQRMLVMTFGWIALALTTGLLQASVSARSHPRRQSPAAAEPFFALDSPVRDYYNGNGANPVLLLREAEVVILLYYAPWSRDSRLARDQFDLMARHYPRNQVMFAAVNCWQPGAQCRNSFKVFSFPVLLAYVRTTQLHVTYHAPFTANYLYRFVDELLNPLLRVDNVAEYLQFSLAHDSTAVMYINRTSDQYDAIRTTLYTAATKLVEHDSVGNQIRLAFTSNPLVYEHWNDTSLLAPAQIRKAHLLHPSSAQIGGVNGSTSWEKLLEWIMDGVRASKTIHSLPTGISILDKNSDLHELLSAGPALLVLAERQLLTHAHLDTTHSLRLLNLVYRDCGTEQESVSELTLAADQLYDRTQLANQRLALAKVECESYDQLRLRYQKCCRTLLTDTVQVTHSAARNICDICPVRLNTHNLHDNTASAQPNPHYCGAKLKSIFTDSDGGEKRKAAHRWTDDTSGRSFGGRSLHDWSSCAWAATVPPETLLKICCSGSTQNDEADRALWPILLPDSSAESIQFCETLKMDGTHQDQLDDFQISESVYNSLVGGACVDVNRTITNMIVLDSALHQPIIKQLLGQDYDHTSDGNLNRNLAFIVDGRNESELVYRMKPSRLTVHNLAELLVDYGLRTLQPYRRSELIEESDSLQRLVQRRYIQSINAQSFTTQVLHAHTDVLLLVTGGAWCAQCEQVKLAFQTIGLLLEKMSLPLFKMSSIDGDRNDLPWQFTVPRFPAIFYYNARISDSVMLPLHVAATVPNLFSFILSQAQPRVRWSIALQLCSRQCRLNNIQVLTKRIRSIRRQLLIDYDLRHSIDNSMDYDGIDGDALSRLLTDQRRRLKQRLRLSRALLRLVTGLNTQGQHLGQTNTDSETMALFLRWLASHQMG